MNKRDWIVLAILVKYGYKTHREIVKRTGYSLGLVNSSLKKLVEEGYIDSEFRITDRTHAHLEESKPRRAVILAAGMGLRMVPINRVPKGLLKINGQPLIERIIKQLHDVGIEEIAVVVGYQMERLEYLTDKFNVELICDHDFARRDSLHSLRLASDKLSNCYIVPCSVWFARNPFNEYEYFSWYAVSEYIDDSSYVRLNRKMELVYTEDENGGNSMIGLCYLRAREAEQVREELISLDGIRKYHRETWERALFIGGGNKMITSARVMLGQSAYEIKTYEELRELDGESQNLRSKRINLISKVLGVEPDAITDISSLIEGMTNHLMRFSVNGKPYLLRVPGEGSNELTDRRQEAEVYHTLEGKDLTEKIIYISPEDGYKIAEFVVGSHNCDSDNWEEVAACMRHLKKLHDMKLEVSHSFSILAKLEEYERLRDGESTFSDYDETRGKVLELLELLEQCPQERCLCHIDSVSDNFLLVDGVVHLIDWEYAGMCDPHIDPAMFSIYADYGKDDVDRVLDLYFDGKVSTLSRFKVYAYMACAGFLWTVWCEYKDKMGVNFGQYAMKQYRYAKRFYKYAMQLADDALTATA